MQYQYAQKSNFEDYASGRFFYSLPGLPAFPVRLASEIFQRAYTHWQAAGRRGPCTIYDPVCGGAYWLAVLAYLHWEAIGEIFASDIDPEVLSLAERNLALLSPSGLDTRITEIEAFLAAYQKESHAGALVSAQTFRQQLRHNLEEHTIQTTVFQADAAHPQSISNGLGGQQVDLVLADIPYGQHSQWQGKGAALETAQTPLWRMLETLHSFLNPGAVLAVTADKRQKVNHPGYTRLEKFQLGKRRIFIIQPQ